MDQGQVVLEGTPEVVLAHQQQLVDLKLDIPFASKFVNALQTAGLDVKNSINREEVVKQLCQLRTSK